MNLFYLITLSLLGSTNLEMRNIALDVSELAYCCHDVGCKSQRNTGVIITNIIQKDSEKVIAGYVDDTIVLGYRGSVNVRNWLYDFQVSLISPYENLEGVKVERGFYTLFTKLKPDVDSIIANLSQKYKSNKLLISGHSLGASCATLTAFDLMKSNKGWNISLITFGSPRVGNQDFVREFNKGVLATKERVTHDGDVFIHTPLISMGFAHIPQEVYYNKDNTEFKICNDSIAEDVNCSLSKKFYQWSVLDHLRYMNITFGSSSC